ncbi:hypothetical protein JXA47_04525 [Candidatus Sumerlaeota bacterium]|nr:hypothetical protein [Candidatus Sumerlaeota bacterium]
MHVRHWALCALAAAAMLLPLTAPAQDLERYMLSEADFRALPAEAQEHYLAGVQALDHIDYQTAHNEYRRAAEIAVDSPALQFNLFELALRQARVSSSRRAEDHLVVAMEALERVINSPASTPAQQSRAERQMVYLERRLSGIQETELSRQETGQTYVHAYALEQDWFNVGRRHPDMTRAILTRQGGGGNPLVRSEVVLIDEAGYLYHADMTDWRDENGVRMTQNNLVGATIETEPSDDFFRGVFEESELQIPGIDASMMGDVDTGTGAQESLFDDTDDWDVTGDNSAMEEETPEVSPSGTEGSLSPVVIDLPDFEENQPSNEPSEDVFNF